MTGLTTTVSPYLAAKLDEMAARLERPRDWIVQQALAAWMDREDESDRLTLEALADVDAGRMVDHDAVKAWVDGLTDGEPLPARKV